MVQDIPFDSPPRRGSKIDAERGAIECFPLKFFTLCLLSWVAMLSPQPAEGAGFSEGAAEFHRELPEIQLSEPGLPLELDVQVAWGEIRVMGQDRDTVKVRARFDGTAEHGAQDVERATALEVSEENNRITVRSPLREAGFWGAYLEIYVPRRTSLLAGMERGGEILAQGLVGDHEVENLNGSIELLDCGGSAVVTAANGSVTASFHQVNPDGALSMVSMNGSIDLAVPADLDADLWVRTANGGLETELPIALAEADSPQLKWLEEVDSANPDLRQKAPRLRLARLGLGGVPVYLFSANGSVLLGPVAPDKVLTSMSQRGAR
ncbi:MAG: hypothetical protein AAGD01_07085 [Acidobacteriota bacterium]